VSSALQVYYADFDFAFFKLAHIYARELKQNSTRSDRGLEAVRDRKKAYG